MNCNPQKVKLNNLNFHHLNLYLAATTHNNFKWGEITHVWLIWDQTLANIDVWTSFHSQ